MYFRWDRATDEIIEIDLPTWARSMDGDEARRVGLDEIGPWRVSTVFLGLNHAFGDGPPEVFETMVFGPDDNLEQDMERYSTAAEARAGHAKFVAEITRLVESLERYMEAPK